MICPKYKNVEPNLLSGFKIGYINMCQFGRWAAKKLQVNIFCGTAVMSSAVNKCSSYYTLYVCRLQYVPILITQFTLP
mgnify:FL=1